MLENCKSARERWGGTHEMIDRWLADRQAALIQFFAIQEATEDDERVTAVLNFCVELVDYVSEGHFEIYEQLFREAKEFDDGGLELAKQLYPKIEEYTQIMLDFNDKYLDDAKVRANLGQLRDDLSTLGEQMTERFEIEDQLIERLHNVHKQALA